MCKEKLKSVINSELQGAWPSQLLDECAEHVMKSTFAPGVEPSWKSYEQTVGDLITIPIYYGVEIRPKVLDFLEQNAPEAWFKPMYMTKSQRAELGIPF